MEASEEGDYFYNFPARSGDRVEGHVMQGDDAKVILTSPDGSQIWEFDYKPSGAEAFHLIAPSDGIYQLQVKTKGSFEIYLAMVEPEASDAEEKLAQAIKLLPPNRPGQAVMIFEGSQLVYQKILGMADVQRQIPLTMETPIPMEFLDEQILAYAIGTLIQQEKVSATSLVSEVIPEFRWGASLTIENLVGGRSGLPNLQALHRFRIGDRKASPSYQQMANQLIQLSRLSFEPGGLSDHRDADHVALRLIIERVGGLAFDEWIKGNLFQPLGMKKSYYSAIGEIQLEVLRPSYFSNSKWVSTRLNDWEFHRPVLNLADWALWQKRMMELSEIGDCGCCRTFLGTHIRAGNKLARVEYEEESELWSLRVNAYSSLSPANLPALAMALLIHGKEWKSSFTKFQNVVGLGGGSFQKYRKLARVASEKLCGTYYCRDVDLELTLILDEWNNFSAVLPYATIPLKVPIEPRTLISNSDWFSKISFDPPVEGVFQEFQLRGNTFANLSFKRK
ncbi:MAG: beta-lactamase family protein [Planctomycetes bacterium]|nr:beta-lactamase family protein [Planctomycetota bacterium]